MENYPWCYPWWHDRFASLRAQPIYVRSDCKVDERGNVPCDPETMRKKAEAFLRAGGFLQSLSLEAYTLARYMQGEVGGGHAPGTVEEAVAVGEAAVNRARLEGKRDVNEILLYRQRPGHPNYGHYGPIHGKGGTSTAPYGRWATTHVDPTVLACVLADFILAGNSDNFSRGADDQAGLEYAANFPLPGSITTWANRGQFWVGPLAGVNHWRTFLVKTSRGQSASTPWGAERVKFTLDHLRADMAANNGARRMAVPWPLDLPRCRRGGGRSQPTAPWPAAARTPAEAPDPRDRRWQVLAIVGLIGATFGALVHLNARLSSAD